MVKGLGVKVEGLGFKVLEGQGFKGRRLTVQDFGFQGFGFRVSRGSG